MQTRNYITKADVYQLRNMWIVELNADNFNDVIITSENVDFYLDKRISTVTLISSDIIYRNLKQTTPDNIEYLEIYGKTSEHVYVLLSGFNTNHSSFLSVDQFVSKFNSPTGEANTRYYRLMTKEEIHICLDHLYSTRFKSTVEVEE